MATKADCKLFAEWNRHRDYKDNDKYHDWLCNSPSHICKAVEHSLMFQSQAMTAKLLMLAITALLVKIPSQQTERRNNTGILPIEAVSIHLLVMTSILICWQGGNTSVVEAYCQASPPLLTPLLLVVLHCPLLISLLS
jgi:hypothetical protein